MRFRFVSCTFFALTLTHFNCSPTKQAVVKPKEVYRSGKLVIYQLAENSFQHISYLQTNDFGNVPCNGLVVRNSGEAIVFDTPTKDSSAIELIGWIKDSLHCKINAVIPTHFHDDCLGGLKAFNDYNIPSYANYKTIELATAKNEVAPKHSFRESVILKIGNGHIIAKFFGEGHTVDNVVGYYPADQVLFGGCLIKELDASKGYLGDANIAAWPATVEKVKLGFPDVKIVVPGHGKPGGIQLLDYTIRLFKAK